MIASIAADADDHLAYRVLVRALIDAGGNERLHQRVIDRAPVVVRRLRVVSICSSPTSPRLKTVPASGP